MSETKKLAVVTGGTGHVGKILIPKMLNSGWHVVVPWRSKSSWEEFHRSLSDHEQNTCTGIEADLTVESDVQRLMEKAGRESGQIDALVNLVGMFFFGTKIHEMTRKKWDTVMDVNLTSTFLCCKHVIPFMLRSREGAIVNFSSKAAVDIQSGAAAYAVAKSGVITLTEAMREELKDTDVTVNAIMPGIIDTAATRKLMPNADHEKWTRPDHIAEAVMSLCEGKLENVSGNVLRMFGKM